MTEERRPKAVFTYCFQVWITGIVVEPTISLCWAAQHFVGQENWWSFEIFMVLYGLLISLPALLLFSGCAALLFSLGWRVSITRLDLSIFGTFLTIATFGIFFNAAFTIHLGDYPGSMCYVLPSLAAVWLYAWPGRMK